MRLLLQHGANVNLATKEGETALDVEWAHAIAPGANILLVEANSASDNDLFAAVNYARSQPGVSVISMSWGSDDNVSYASYDQSMSSQYLVTPSGHQGVTFVASSGDTGVPNFPSTSPNVLAVGVPGLNYTCRLRQLIADLNNYAAELDAWSERETTETADSARICARSAAGRAWIDRPIRAGRRGSTQESCVSCLHRTRPAG